MSGKHDGGARHDSDDSSTGEGGVGVGLGQLGSGESSYNAGGE